MLTIAIVAILFFTLTTVLLLMLIYSLMADTEKVPLSFKKILSSSPRYLLLAIIVLAFVFPLYFLVNLSLQNQRGIDEALLYPRNVFLGWWMVLTTDKSWVSALRNSLIICASCVLLSVAVCFPAAYAVSRSKFIADKHLFFWMFFYRMAPPICFILPFLAIYRGMGLYDTIPGVILSYCLFNIPLGTWLMISFMSGIPKEIDESAFIDGHSLLSFFRKIFIPLCKPGIAVTSFFIWLFSWTEWFIAFTITSIEAKTLTCQMLVFVSGFGVSLPFVGLAAVGGVLTTIPGLILILWARTYLARGFSFGKM